MTYIQTTQGRTVTKLLTHSLFGKFMQEQQRLKSLKSAFERLAKHPVEKSLEKYISYRDEVNLIYFSFRKAASDLYQAVDEAIDRRLESR